MPNTELDTIAASMTDAIHRAYALGRGDALRRVVEMVQADELGGKAVALLGPADPSPAERPSERKIERQSERHDEPHAIEVAAPAEQPMHAAEPAEAGEPAPWWRR